MPRTAFAIDGGIRHIPSRRTGVAPTFPSCGGFESIEAFELRKGLLGEGERDGEALVAEGVADGVIQETCEGPLRILSSVRVEG